jgi:hypothetical protein
MGYDGIRWDTMGYDGIRQDAIGECLVLLMFSELRMSLRRRLALFSEIFDEDDLLHGYGYGNRMEKAGKIFQNFFLRSISSETKIDLWIFI